MERPPAEFDGFMGKGCTMMHPYIVDIKYITYHYLAESSP